MADNNVYVKCSDDLETRLESFRVKMESTYSNQSDKDTSSQTIDPLKRLYPNVNEDITPLPRSWSTQEKNTSIGLNKNNLRVHYKGFFFLTIVQFNYQYREYLSQCLSFSIKWITWRFIAGIDCLYHGHFTGAMHAIFLCHSCVFWCELFLNLNA